MDGILQILFTVLQTILPPLIVKWVTDLVKKWKETLTAKQITGLVVPILSVIVSVVDYYLTGANYVWTFLLGMLAIAVHEIWKNFTTKE